MKKFFTKLITLVIAGALTLGALAGCDLITTNTDRDMAQVVAEISIDDSFNEKIYKRQLVSEYNSYGYTYEMYYGYTKSEVYELILENLVENRIISQQSRKALTSKTDIPGNETSYFSQANAVADADKTSKEHVLSGVNYKGTAFTELTSNSAPAEFLTNYEYQYARYSVLSSVNSLLQNYIESTETKVDDYEVFVVTDRATLTQKETPEGDEWELKNDEEIKVIDEETKKTIKQLVKDNELTINVDSYTDKYTLLVDFYTEYNTKFVNKITSKEGKSALVKIIRSLKNVGVISEEEAAKATPKTVDELLAITYFKDTLTVAYENQIINKYKLALQNQLEKGINPDTLYAEYKNLFNTQKADYNSSNSKYETALSESGEDTFVVYNPGNTAVNNGYNGYGYVLNLLIGFDDMQTALLNEYKAKKGITKTQIENYRKELLKTLTAKDQRATWIYSGYGAYDEATKKYTFKDSYVKTLELREFNGVLNGAKSYNYLDSYGEASKGYTFTSVKSNEIPFDTFYTSVVESIMGFSGYEGSLNSVKTETLDTAIIEKYRDIVYAYSTDSGSVAENLGYVYSPVTSSTKYVKEFSAAAKRVVDAGAGAYEVVATDYGYHIILCTKAIKATGNDMLTDPQFKADLLVKDTLAYNFKQYKLELVVSNEVSNKATSFINTNKSKVTYYEDTYSDLIEKEDK